MDYDTPQETYLFTFSPNDTTCDVDKSYAIQLGKYFSKWHTCMSEFEINPELNVNGNLHYHGYFVLTDKIKWFKKILPTLKYNGFVKINKVKDNLEKALVYCRKDNEMMSKLITQNKVPWIYSKDLFQCPIKVESELLKNTIEASLLADQYVTDYTQEFDFEVDLDNFK